MNGIKLRLGSQKNYHGRCSVSRKNCYGKGMYNLPEFAKMASHGYKAGRCCKSVIGNPKDLDFWLSIEITPIHLGHRLHNIYVLTLCH